MPTLHLHITGRVQGVYFRASTKAEADRLGITGYARNEPDGSVTITATGDREALEELRAWCDHGPEKAHVEHIDEQWHETDETFADFGVQ